jgi:sec-independent protein translocase protein TatA
MGFGNLGFGEILMILVIVLVLFGAKRVPEIGASIGKGIREFKKNVSEAERQIREPQPPEQVGSGTVRRQEEDVRPEPKRLM